MTFLALYDEPEAERLGAVWVQSSPDHGSSASPSLTKVNTAPSRTSAEIVIHPKPKLPPVADYAARCAALIRETFPARSQHQTCIDAARMTGTSPDTIERILNGLTKSPDARLMIAVMGVRAATGKGDFALGNGFAIRIIMEGMA